MPLGTPAKVTDVPVSGTLTMAPPPGIEATLNTYDVGVPPLPAAQESETVFPDTIAGFNVGAPGRLEGEMVTVTSKEREMTRRILWLIAAAVVLLPARASAQVFGTFTWQMQPYCNRVTLTLTNSPGGFTLSGSDDRCGAVSKSGATGVAVFNANGTLGLNFTIVTSPAGLAVHVSASVSPANGQGTWSDDVGNSGTFAFGGNAAGLPVRPSIMTPIDVAENPKGATDPCFVPTVRPTLLLCGNSASHWRNGGFGLSGLQVWRDSNGQVHIRGSVNRSAGGVNGAVFVLPASFVPRRTLALTVSTGIQAGAQQGGTALLIILGSVPESEDLVGLVSVFSASNPGHTVAHFGEVVFTVDR